MILRVSVHGLEKTGFSGKFRGTVLVDCFQEGREENEVGLSVILCSFRDFCGKRQRTSRKVVVR